MIFHICYSNISVGSFVRRKTHSFRESLTAFNRCDISDSTPFPPFRQLKRYIILDTFHGPILELLIM